MKKRIDTTDVVHFEEALATPYESGLPIGHAPLRKTATVDPWQESIPPDHPEFPKGVALAGHPKPDNTAQPPLFQCAHCRSKFSNFSGSCPNCGSSDSEVLWLPYQSSYFPKASTFVY